MSKEATMTIADCYAAEQHRFSFRLRNKHFNRLVDSEEWARVRDAYDEPTPGYSSYDMAPDNAAAHAGLIRSLTQAGETDAARAALDAALGPGRGHDLCILWP